MNFRNIRIYGHEYEPEYFKGAGIRGWWLRVLNRVRLSLELRCQFHAMMLLGKRLGVDTERLGQQVRKDQSKVVDWIRKSKEFQNLATAVDVSKQAESVSEVTSKSLARLTAQGRSKRYRYGRGTFPIYEAEAYPNGPEGSENARTTDQDRTH